MIEQIQIRRDTAANWTSANPTLAQGEPALETDTGFQKMGDGVTAWNSLAYALSKAGLASTTSATLGQGLVGFNPALSYPAGTLPAALASTASGQGDALVGVLSGQTGAVARTQHQKNADTIFAKDFGAIGDGVTDDTVALINAFNSLSTNQILDLGGLRYSVYNSVSGTTGTTDSVPITSVVRLANKIGVTIRNGTIFTANPSVSGTKYNFPSTLCIDSCTNVRLDNLQVYAKGESWGWSDNAPLTYPVHHTYIQKNGGSALIVVYCQNTTINNSKFVLAGSVGAAYVSSSANTVFNNCYGTPQDYGYAGFAMDAFCGGVSYVTTNSDPYTTNNPILPISVTSFTTTLNNCSSDANGTAYGSKACVNPADTDCICYVNGGVYRDAYPTGGSGAILGNAFAVTDSACYVTGAIIDNCASVGGMFNDNSGSNTLICSGTIATNIRTSALILSASQGSINVQFNNCNIKVIGSVVWTPFPTYPYELSISTAVANLSTNIIPCKVEFNNCRVVGADTFAINASGAVTGGIRVNGGHYEVAHRIFDSVGWGGSGAGSQLGYELLGGAQFQITAASTSTAITQATQAVNAITNYDSYFGTSAPHGVHTFQYINFDSSVIIEGNPSANFIWDSIITSGNGEILFRAQQLLSCAQSSAVGKANQVTAKAVSLDGISGSFYKITFAFFSNKIPNGQAFLIDDANNIRVVQGTYNSLGYSAGYATIGLYLNTTSANITVGNMYSLQVAD